MRLIFSASALSLPVFVQVRENIVDSRLQGLDGAAYLAQLGVHFPFDVGLSHRDHWTVTAVC